MTIYMRELPHDPYMAKVDDALEALGISVKDAWTETPDGEQLDAVFKFNDPRIDAEWPDGIYLAWDQRRGWALITECDSRSVYDFDLGEYAHPHAVALIAKEMLLGEEILPSVDAPWDGGQEVMSAVKAWEAEGCDHS